MAVLISLFILFLLEKVAYHMPETVTNACLKLRTVYNLIQQGVLLPRPPDRPSWAKYAADTSDARYYNHCSSAFLV